MRFHNDKTNNLVFQPGPTQSGPIVQSQTQVRSLRCWIEGEKALYYLCSENKDGDQLLHSCSVPLFSPMHVVGFLK